MTSIYSDVLACEQLIDEEFDAETGEVTLENEENIEWVAEQKKKIIEQGVERLCKVLANKNAYVEGLKVEKQRITNKLSSEVKKINNLKKYIMEIHKKNSQPKTIAGAFTVSLKKSKSVVLDEGFENKEYGSYTYSADKTAIKKALSNGTQIDGANIIVNENLQVK